MNDTKYIGLDVHQATISAAVLDSTGKLLMESVVETRASTILQFIHGLRGSVQVTFEEGTCAAWLYDLLKPHVTQVLVCDPRKNALIKAGNKSDRIDARKLADLLYLNKLNPVYHGETGIRALKEVARSYLALTRDTTRGTSTSGEYRIVEGQLKRSKKFLAIRGLNANHNHDLKNIFKGAATRAAAVPGPFQEFHAGLVARGMKPTMARLTLARKIAAIALIVWKKGVSFDAEHLKQQAA